MSSEACKHFDSRSQHVPFNGYELTCRKCRKQWVVSGCGVDIEGTADLVAYSRPCPCGGIADGIVPAAVLENTVQVSVKT
jgi:hypothetical protein